MVRFFNEPTMSNISEAKVLPFNDANGLDVPGHAIIRHNDVGAIERVVFQHVDRQADLSVEIVVHWTEWSKFRKKAPDRSHTVKAVILEGGRRISATTYSVSHYDAAACNRAPILARGVFKVAALGTRATLLEIAGVEAWSHSQRRPEDAALIVNPWARDNAEFAARMARAHAPVSAETS